ncbi:MAG: MFS transporter [Candidatus Thorarchaeota archaeon]
MEKNEKKIVFNQFIKSQIIIIGVLFCADQFFGFMEQNFFNTYIEHILGLQYIYIAIMVNLSALMGLIFNLTWGIISDNTRGRFGRRRPYLLVGGVTAGVAMILYSFSPNYFWVIFFDVIIIGVASNAYFSSERALIPDTVDKEQRGRANGMITVFGNVGILIAVAFFLLVYELFAEPDPVDPTENILTIEGYFFILASGGVFFIFTGFLGFFKIKEKSVEELPPRKKFGEDLKALFSRQTVSEHKDFFKMIGAYIIFKTGINLVLPFLFNFLFDLGLSTLELLIGIAVGFPILVLSTLFMGRISDKYGRKKFIPIFILIVSIGFFSMLFVKNPATSEVNLGIFIFSLPFILVGILGLTAPLDAWSQDLLPEDMRGKFGGIYNLMWVVSQFIGSTAGGIIGDTIGLVWIFCFGPIILIASIPFFLNVKETLDTI